MSESTKKSPTESLTDFPDRLSPVLVKELRQGLRTNLFVIAFILLQAFMILCMMMGQPGDSTASDGAFWFFILTVFLIIQPLRGFSSLSSEFSFNTMDLIQLTKLNAFRITMGKWTALNAQSLLLMVSVLPYLVMRYFYGSVDVIGDFQKLLGYAYSSAILTAIAVGCSAFKQIIPRLILLIASVWAFFAAFFEIRYYDRIDILLAVFAGLFIGAYFIMLGSSRIAPQSENHSTRKRLVALIGSIGCLAFLPFVDEDLALAASGLIIGIAIIDALTEKMPIFHGVLPKFSSSIGKRFLSGFLVPGWHTGFRFALIATIPIAVAAFLINNSMPLFAPFLIFSVLTFPLLIIHLFFRRSNLDHLALYVAIQACVGAIVLLIVGVADTLPSGADDMAFLLVPIPGVLWAGVSYLDDEIILLISAGWCILIVLVMMIASRAPFRAMRDYFQMHKK